MSDELPRHSVEHLQAKVRELMERALKAEAGLSAARAKMVAHDEEMAIVGLACTISDKCSVLPVPGQVDCIGIEGRLARAVQAYRDAV